MIDKAFSFMLHTTQSPICNHYHLVYPLNSGALTL